MKTQKFPFKEVQCFIQARVFTDLPQPHRAEDKTNDGLEESVVGDRTLLVTSVVGDGLEESVARLTLLVE